jgi:hypothetical protein
MARRPRPAIGSRNESDDVKTLHPTLHYDAPIRRRPQVRRILLVAGTSVEMWTAIILGLLLAGVLHLLP